MRNPTILLLAILFSGPAPASTIALYDNTHSPAADTNNDLTYSAGGYDGIGDAITLTVSGVATSARIQLYNEGTAGTFDALLLFYNAGSPVGTPIGSYSLTDIPAGENAYVDVVFDGLNLTVPLDLVYILQVANLSSGLDLGAELYSGTAVGTNRADSALVQVGSSIGAVSTGGYGNPAFELTSETESAVPEPSTWLATGTALLLCLCWKGRRIAAACLLER